MKKKPEISSKEMNGKYEGETKEIIQQLLNIISIIENKAASKDKITEKETVICFVLFFVLFLFFLFLLCFVLFFCFLFFFHVLNPGTLLETVYRK